MFTELWVLETAPALKEPLPLLTVRGVAYTEDRNEQARTVVLFDLADKEKRRKVGDALERIIANVVPPAVAPLQETEEQLARANAFDSTNLHVSDGGWLVGGRQALTSPPCLFCLHR